MEPNATYLATASIQPLAVSLEEAQRITALGRSSIYKAIAAGDLQSFKSGRRRLILVRELDRWISRLAKENSK